MIQQLSCRLQQVVFPKPKWLGNLWVPLIQTDVVLLKLHAKCTQLKMQVADRHRNSGWASILCCLMLMEISLIKVSLPPSTPGVINVFKELFYLYILLHRWKLLVLSVKIWRCEPQNNHSKVNCFTLWCSKDWHANQWFRYSAGLDSSYQDIRIDLWSKH